MRVFGRRDKMPAARRRGLCSLSADFLASSSIHGVALVAAAPRRSALERWCWVLLVGIAVACAVLVSLSTWSRFADSPTVISVERDFRAWSTPFPACTVCPSHAAAEGEEEEELSLRRTAKELWRGDGAPPEALASFLRAFRSATLGSLWKLRPFANSQDLLPPSVDLKRLFLLLQPNFTFEVSGAGDSLSASPRPLLTEAGLCHVVRLRARVSAPAAEGRPRSMAAGNPLDGDAHVQLVQMSHGYQVYFHSPWDEADVFSRALSSPVGHYATVDLAAAAMLTTEEARLGLTAEQRSCRFLDEGGGGRGYSYNACRTGCRARLALRLCSCVPFHLLPPQQGIASVPCDVLGLICLSEHEDLLIKLPAASHGDWCGCVPMCEDVHYRAVRLDIIQWPLGNSLKWGITKFPRTRHKRDVLFGFSDLLGSMGGAAGLFLGCSLLSAVEVLYFVTLRAFWTLRGCFGGKVYFAK